ncbi:general stress protein [Niallia alba]|uniref:general stress protein n=1 Tax=Niallia alba TaxID=2729105 RepID=UPI00033289C6|nr:stress response protein [Niallia nealsonii AAU1]MDU1844201.1 general stress protein [Niallia nealsonii]
MTKSVVGIYDSPEATVDAIEELLSKGYSPDHISVITRNEQVALIEQETEVNTTSAINEVEPVSFLDRLKNFFSGTDLEPYEEELQAGKYIVLLDNDAETEEEKLNKLSFDNSEVDVIPSQTMNTTVERKKVE